MGTIYDLFRQQQGLDPEALGVEGIVPGLNGQLNDLASASNYGGAPVPPPVPTSAPQGMMDKADSFLGSNSGRFLMNLLAQQGYSTMPGSPLGAVGRAANDTRVQQENTALNRARTSALDRGMGIGNSQSPSAVREFEFFEGLSEDAKRRYLAVKRAQQLENVPGAGLGSVNPLDNTLNTIVPEETIVGGIGDRAGSAEDAKQQAITDAIPGRVAAQDLADATRDAPADLAESQTFLAEGREYIRQLKSGELETGPIRGKAPAFTTNEQLFQAWSGEQVLDKISEATFGALSEGEREFLRSTVTNRENTEEANIQLIEKKMKLIEDTDARLRKKTGAPSGDENVTYYDSKGNRI